MAADWNPGLLEPISDESPCGQNLENSGELAVLESYQIFGQDTLEPPENVPKRDPRKSDRPPNWRELEQTAAESVAKSKDLRVLAHLSACALRIHDLATFTSTLGAASFWLETWWNRVYPLVDEDAVLRTNALNAFADRPAIIDGLRRVPLISGPLGKFSLRDIEASGSKGEADGQPEDSTISAAFSAAPIEDLRALQTQALDGAASLRKIEQTMREQAGIEASPTFDALLAQLQGLASALKARIAAHPAAVPGVDTGVGDDAAAGAAGAGGALGAVRSRQDAIRALDAVAGFFRRSEPSSPVPLLVDRAKRLVSKDFLEVLADLAPGGLPEAKSAGGIRD